MEVLSWGRTGVADLWRSEIAGESSELLEIVGSLCLDEGWVAATWIVVLEMVLPLLLPTTVSLPLLTTICDKLLV